MRRRRSRNQDFGRRRSRRIAIAGLTSLVIVASWHLTAGADGGLEVTPPSGPRGARYQVQVTCGVTPSIFQANTQGDRVQGTIAPRLPDDVTEVSPSVWAIDETAGDWDSAYYATCDDVEVGTGRFDTDSPRLWLGPRPTNIADSDPQTTLEGTDCPEGSGATAVFTIGELRRTLTADVDARGDWSVRLPIPIGSAAMTIEASCGDVVYDLLDIRGRPGTTPSIVSDIVPATAPEAPAATPEPGSAHYTG